MSDVRQVDESGERAPSVGAMLLRRVELTPDKEAFRFPDRWERWVSLTWSQVEEIVTELAAGLLSLGLEPEERVAIAASTRIEWILADLAVMCAGGATTTVYPSTQDRDVAFIMSDSDTRIAFLENAEQLAKVHKHDQVYSRLRGAVLFDGESEEEYVSTWGELRERGRQHLAENPACVKNAIAGTGPESLSTLIYTSGTTGRPKGVRLVHDCWTYEGRAVELLELIDESDLQYLWLPLSHVFGKCLIAIQLQIGFSTAVDGRIDKIVDNLGEVRPTFMCGAPRIFEKVRAKAMIGNSTGIKKQIARWAFSVGQKSNEYRIHGKSMPKVLAAQYAVADALVFKKLRDKMGGRLRYLVSGSAKLSSQVQDWFFAAGLMIFEGYGMTETSAVTFVSNPSRPVLGSVGPKVPGTDCKIAEDGEILVKGPGVMRGYHNRPEDTEAAFSDGWFHTGDVGYLDENGNLHITDRKKDLIKTSGGKYVAPQKVEGTLVANCPYISQVVIHGEGRKYITALLALDPDAIRGWAAHHEEGKLKDLSNEELSQHAETKAMLQRYVDKANQRLERWETIKKFAVMERELSLDKGEVTPSLKIRRSRVEESYSDVFDSLYDKEI